MDISQWLAQLVEFICGSKGNTSLTFYFNPYIVPLFYGAKVMLKFIFANIFFIF
jgi:hypothetical protein